MSRQALDDRLEIIEAGYEFMLAYAAQGRHSEEGGSGPEIRVIVRDMIYALDGITETVESVADEIDAFMSIVAADAARAQAALALVAAQPRISSQLIDNLNASLHLRTLLTDLFLLDEALRAGAGAKQ